MTNQDFQQPKSILDMVESTVSFLSVSVFSTFPKIIYLNFYFFFCLSLSVFSNLPNLKILDGIPKLPEDCSPPDVRFFYRMCTIL